MDVPGKKRDDVIDYLKEKYGKEYVSQMITFGRLQGRSAIKEVLRVNEACSFSEMNAITKVCLMRQTFRSISEMMKKTDLSLDGL